MIDKNDLDWYTVEKMPDWWYAIPSRVPATEPCDDCNKDVTATCIRHDHQ